MRAFIVRGMAARHKAPSNAETTIASLASSVQAVGNAAPPIQLIAAMAKTIAMKALCADAAMHVSRLNKPRNKGRKRNANAQSKDG
jgi:hypothetical protein